VALRVIGVLLLLGCGCANVAALQRPNTCGAGNGELAVEVAQQALFNKDSFTSYPMVGLAGRYGVTDSFDMGGRIGPSGFELQAKVMLDSPQSRYPISLAPSAGMSVVDTGGVALRFYTFAIPLLIGIPLPRGHQIVIAPRVADSISYISAGTAGGLINVFSGGGSVGVAFHVWRLWLLPEIGLQAPVTSTAIRSDVSGGTALGGARATAQGSLAVIWGG
jgi:hypothetical protein